MSFIYDAIFQTYISDIEHDLITLNDRFMCTETCPCASDDPSKSGDSASQSSSKKYYTSLMQCFEDKRVDEAASDETKAMVE